MGEWQNTTDAKTPQSQTRRPGRTSWPSQGAASMTTRKQIAIVIFAMLTLFALGQMFLSMLPVAGQ
jgi:hypothetical protein